MPWKASSVMEERLRFVARLLDGEAMTEICRNFGISRKTGYKIFDRYKEYGLEALTDRSRRPVRDANQLPQQIESLIVQLKTGKPHWGARKIRELLVRRLDGDIRVPAKSIIHAVLDRHGLVKRGGGPRVDDRRVLNGIFWVLLSGSPWADVLERYGPPTTVYNRFNRWRKAGVWDRLMDAIIAAHDGKVQMIDSSACGCISKPPPKKTGWRRFYRSKSWRTDHQITSSGNRQRPAGPDRAFAGADERRTNGRTPTQRSARRRGSHRPSSRNDLGERCVMCPCSAQPE